MTLFIQGIYFIFFYFIYFIYLIYFIFLFILFIYSFLFIYLFICLSALHLFISSFSLSTSSPHHLILFSSLKRFQRPLNHLQTLFKHQLTPSFHRNSPTEYWLKWTDFWLIFFPYISSSSSIHHLILFSSLKRFQRPLNHLQTLFKHQLTPLFSSLLPQYWLKWTDCWLIFFLYISSSSSIHHRILFSSLKRFQWPLNHLQTLFKHQLTPSFHHFSLNTDSNGLILGSFSLSTSALHYLFIISSCSPL